MIVPFGLPKKWHFQRVSLCSHLIWASGIKTWEKLAQRGYWVNGCAESLGEREDPRLENFSDKLDWLKLTHTKALHGQGRLSKEVLGTYQLKPRPHKHSLSHKTHFYWMSGSQFAEAIQYYPEIKKAYHACGPGHTYERVREILGDSSHIDIFLSIEEWEQACQGGQK